MSEEQATPNAQGGGQQPDSGDERTFTQAELNAIVSDRLSREQRKYADYDDLKAAAEQLQELEDAQKSELERAQQAREEAERKADQAMQNAKDRLLRAQFIAEAAKHGATHPEDAFALADRGGITEQDDGSFAGIADAVETLVQAGRLPTQGRPNLPSLDGGTGSGERPSGDAAKLTPDELRTAKAMNLTPEEYAKHKQ